MPRPKKRQRPSRAAPLNPATAVFLGQNEYTFQRVCQEAYSSEPDVAVCSVYGNQGEKQNGIDLKSTRHDAQGLEVVQCRRYAAFSAANVRTATTDFFDEWPHWKSQKVRRFVLVTSADISAKKVQLEIEAQRRIFRTKRIKYDAWGCHELCTKLQPHRSAVQHLYGGEGADKLLGTMPDTPALRAATSFLTNSLGHILVELEKERSDQLEAVRELSWEGRRRDALAKLMAIRQAPSWPGFTAPLRARCLRVEASLRLNVGEAVAAAAALVADAKQLDPSADFQVIEAHLAYREHDAAAGLARLAAPASVDAWNTRWVLLLESGRPAEIPGEFRARDAAFAANGETRRLLALSALLAGDLPAAQAEIARASSLQPKHRGIRLAGAMIDFRSCVSAAADAGPTLAWPTPVAWAFVRRDADSLVRLRRAAAAFAELRQLPDEPESEKRLHETWELACLACDPTRATEAEACAQARLQETPAHFRVALWAVERDYAFDRDRVEVALAAELLKPKADLDAHLALGAVLLADGKAKAAEKALDAAEAVFVAGGNHDIWKVQKVQLLARRGARTAKVLASIVDPKLREVGRRAALNPGKGRRSDFRKLARGLEKAYAQTGSPEVLFQCCDAYYRAQEFKFLGEQAVTLVEKLGTDTALRLALHGSFHAGRHQQCLDLLTKHRGLLQGGVLSPELRRLQAACKEKVGQWEEAIKEAEALYREKAGIAGFEDYFRLLVQTGNTRRATLLAGELLTMAGTTVPVLLRAAHVARLHDMELARELWRKAAKMPLRTAVLVANVVHLAFELGVEQEAAALQQRMFAGAKRKGGPVQLQTMDQTIELFRQRRSELERLTGVYNRSEAPIHLIAPQLGVPLAQLYHQQLEDSRATKNLTAVPTLLARYGGRAMPESCPPAVLYADLTGLLLAADLGVLELIEQNLGPIRIAPETTLSLVEQVGRCRPHQPSQHVWRETLERMVRAGEIRLADRQEEAPVPADHALAALGPEWHAVRRTAEEEKAVLAAEWPLFAADDDRQVMTVPAELAEGIVNLRELIRAAVLAGGLPEAEFAAQTGPLGVFRQYPQRDDAGLKWAAGRTVLMTDITLQILAGQGLLAAVGGVFKLVVLRKDFERIEAEEKSHARQMALAEWTQAFLEQIQRGIAQNRYRVLPQTVMDPNAGKMGAEARGLGNLMRAVANDPQGTLWVDDRMINCFNNTGPRPIVGILEVLRMLQAKGVLTDAAWAERLTHLRRSNVRYIPTTSAEVRTHLRQAQVVEGELVETPALATLRRYYGACGLDRWRLLGPGKPGPGQDVREWKFVLDLRSAVDEAFRGVWAQPDVAPEVRLAQANWLWRSLYVDLVAVRHTLVDNFTAGEERNLTAFMVGSLFALGIGMTIQKAKKGVVTPQEAYFEWLDTRLLLPLENSNPGFTDDVAAVVAKDLVTTCRLALGTKSPEARKVQVFIAANVMMSLPEPLLQKIKLPAEILAEMKVTVQGPSLDVDEHTYDLEALSDAQAEALRGKPSSVKERSGDQVLYLERDGAAEGLVLKMRTDPSGAAKNWRDPMFGVLLDRVAERMAHLEKQPLWFDCDAETRRKAIHDICVTDRAVDRVTKTQGWMNGSPQFAYADIERRLKGKDGVGFEEIRLTDWRRLLRHLRLKEVPTGSAVEELAAAAEILLREEGLFFALRRCMAQPRRLPAVLEQAWQALPVAGAVEMWGKLPRYPRSVLGDLHLIRLAHLRDDVDRAPVQKLVAELFDPERGPVLFDSFDAVLNWVNREMHRWPERHQLHAWQRLAMVWYHAARLHGLFRAGPVELPLLSKWFKENSSAWHPGVMDYETAYAEDVCHPNLAGTGSILVNGLGHLLEGLPANVVDALGMPEKWKGLVEKDAQYAALMTLDLCRRRNHAQNALGAFLSASSEDMRTRLLGAGWDQSVTRAKSDDELAELIAAAARAPTLTEAWSPLLSTLREMPAPPDCWAALRSLLVTMDFADFVPKENGWGLAMLIFATAQTRSRPDAALRERLEEQVMKIATGHWRAKLVGDEAKRCDFSLMQALLALSIVPGDQVATASGYFEKLARLLRAQPAAAPIMNLPVRHWAVSLPFEQQRGLRALWYIVRALQ